MEYTVKASHILAWHGSDHDIDELAQYLADLLNGELTIKESRTEILDYNDNK